MKIRLLRFVTYLKQINHISNRMNINQAFLLLRVFRYYDYKVITKDLSFVNKRNPLSVAIKHSIPKLIIRRILNTINNSIEMGLTSCKLKLYS